MREALPPLPCCKERQAREKGKDLQNDSSFRPACCLCLQPLRLADSPSKMRQTGAVDDEGKLQAGGSEPTGGGPVCTRDPLARVREVPPLTGWKNKVRFDEFE